MLAACDKSERSYSLLSDSQQFEQNPGTVVQNKVDILWVVDNSGSMRPFQQNLATNFASFMTNFVGKGYDFHMAVTTSDAYLAGARWRNNPAYSRFKDGTSVKTGIRIIDMFTDNPVGVFAINADVDDRGSGDERAFSSFKAALENPQNASFRRDDAFLAIIILSDEDDFSNPNRGEGSGTNHNYNNSGLETVDSYVQYLDNYTLTTDPNLRRYNVSAVTVKDTACYNQQRSFGAIIGQRYIELVNKTGGILADLCSPNYAPELDQIQAKIVELSTQFVLNREPIPETIRVWVDGLSVPESATDGWTYVASSNSIVFHGSAIPAQGALINVVFDPVAPKN